MSLFKTNAEFKAVFPIKVVFELEDIQANITSAEEEYLAEQFLGEAQYQELHTAYQADSMSAEQEVLLLKCQIAIAPMAVFHYTGVANVSLEQGGLTVASTANYVPASEWRTRDLERAVLRLGYRALDRLQQYLVTNSTLFPTYEASTAYTELTTAFVRSTLDVDGVVRIGNSGYLYRQLLPALRRAEEGPVKDTLCSTALRDDLVAKLTAGSLSADEKQLVTLARNAAVHLAMASSIVQLSLGTDERGIWTFGALLGGQTSGGPTAAADERLNTRVRHENALGAGYLASLKKELQRQAEADSGHAYRTSSCYIDPTASVAPTVDPDSSTAAFL